MTKLLVLALVTATLALPLVADASKGKCDSAGAPALGIVEISPANDPASTFYVDDRNIALGNGVWTYQESNGVFTGGDAAKDLQRGGSSQIQPDDSETCVDDPNIVPDTLIS